MKFRDNKLLKHFVWKNIWWVLLIFGLIVLANCCRVWAAARVETIVDMLSARSQPLSVVLGFILLSALIMFAYYAGRYVYQMIGKYLTFKLATVTRVKLTEHLAKIPFRKYEEFVVGDVQSIIRNDVTAATEIMGMMTMLVANLFLLLVTAAIWSISIQKRGSLLFPFQLWFLL